MSKCKEEITDAQKRAVELMGDIIKACTKHKLNMTVQDGKIGFVDQEQMKIVMIWSPEYKIGGTENGKN